MKPVPDAPPSERWIAQVLLLTTLCWCANYGRFTLGPVQEMVQGDLRLSDNQIAFIQGPAFAIPMTFAAIPLGLLSDRYRRGPLFLAFVLLGLVATLLQAITGDFAGLICARVMSGISVAGILVSAFAAVGDLCTPSERGRATMFVIFGETGGAPSAFAIGGAFIAAAAILPFSFGLDSWRLTMLWMGAPFLLILVLLLMYREPPRRALGETKPPISTVAPVLWHHRGVVLPLLMARIMVWIADGAVVVWGAPTFSRIYHLSPVMVSGLMATVLLIASIAGPLIGGPLADYCQRTGGPRRTMVALGVVALISVPAGCFGMMPNVTLAAAALTVLLTLGFTIGVPTIALATIVVPAEVRGAYLALTVTVAAICSIGIAPMVVSGLSGLYSGPDALGVSLALVCSGTSLLGFLVFVFGSRGYPTAEANGAVPADA